MKLKCTSFVRALLICSVPLVGILIAGCSSATDQPEFSDVPAPSHAMTGSPVQWIFAKGPGYLCCSLSSADDLVSQPEERLVALADSELRCRLPELSQATLLRGVAVRDPEATFVPAPGLRRPGPATALANTVLAGCWTDTGWPATMEGAVRSGRAAARTLVATLRKQERAAGRAPAPPGSRRSRAGVGHE